MLLSIRTLPILLSMTLKSLAVTYRLHAAELPLANGEIAGDRQRAVVVVEHGDLIDVHAVRLQLDLARRCSCS